MAVMSEDDDWVKEQFDYLKYGKTKKTEPPPKRLSFEEYGFLKALAASGRSEDPHTQVGGAVFRADNKRFLSSGYNGLASGMDWPIEFDTDRDLKGELIIHCEQNLKLQTPDIDKIVFLTMAPCFSCSKFLSSPLARVREVYSLKEYGRDKEKKYQKVFDFYNIKYKLATKQQIKNIAVHMEKSLADLTNLL